jgi:pimeloyl-ACP methyl ester carboxylesterase
MDLEIIQRSTQAQGQPILFVHGILSAAWIWDVNFLPWFAEQGYQAYALSLRGHGGSPADKPIKPAKNRYWLGIRWVVWWSSAIYLNFARLLHCWLVVCPHKA